MSDTRITVDELDAIFGGRVPMVAMKLLYPEKSEALTTDEMRTILRALAPPPDATLLAAANAQVEVERMRAHIAATCRQCNGTGIRGGSGGTNPPRSKIWPCDHGLTAIKETTDATP